MQRPIALLRPIPLDIKVHDRDSFCSGVSELDQFLKLRARKEAEQNLNKTFVLCPKENPSEIAGYYTLSNKQINTSDLPDAVTKKLPRYKSIGATLLGRLAVTEKFQSANCPGQHIGAMLLNDAKLRAWNASKSVGSFALIVDVLVGEKGDPTNFYTKYDFVQFPEDRRRLYLPMCSIEKALRASGLIP